MASTVSNGNDRSEKWHRPFQMATTVYEREICGVDPFLAFGVLACRILDCASWLCRLLSDKLCCLRLKLELLAFGILRNYCESLSMFSSFVSAGVEFHVLASFLVCWLDGCASLGKLRCLS